ncbi:alpha/beta hydrolase [Pseudonocardiaceae bacterium YIM PH 21723]|nr:alpha/beta hydrolase [Pseudonocardiaceae bacterium YIM PH 21723]
MSHLHPQAALVVRKRGKVTLTNGSVPQERRSLIASTPAEVGPVIDLPHVDDLDAGGVPVRLYRPATAGNLGVTLYLHGGGWVLGNLDTVDNLCRRLAKVSGCAVLSVDYRLAPEFPWPAAMLDVDAVLAWVRESGDRYGLDARRVAVTGDSAGAQLATVAARRARDAGAPLAFQALIYPALDPSMSADSYREMADYCLSPEEMSYFWAAFIPPGADRRDPDITPLHADLAGLPPALVLTAEFDVLRDEGERYARLLAAAGVPTVSVRYSGMVHGFFRRFALYDAAAVAADHVAGAIRTALIPPCDPK